MTDTPTPGTGVPVARRMRAGVAARAGGLLLLGALVGACTSPGGAAGPTLYAGGTLPSPAAAPATLEPSAGDGVADVADPETERLWAEAEALIDEYYWVVPYPEDIPEREELAAQAWAAALATICPAEGPVSCAPDTFAPVVWTDGMVYVLDTSIEVVAADAARARAAVAAAGERYYLIDTEGREWDPAELEEAWLTDEEEVFTSPFVSDLVEEGGAVGFWFDVEGNPYPKMARAQILILLEELERAGITEARIQPLSATPYG